jgi:hypothetical protein
MRWLVSLFMGLIIAWIIVSNVNKMPRVSYYQAPLDPADIATADNSLVAVGLAQFPQVPSIMDSINKPVKYTGKPTVVQGSLPDPNFTPMPGMKTMTPGPVATRPVSSPGSSVSSPAGFATPAPAPGPATQMPSPAPAPAPAPFATSSSSGSPYPSS